MEAAGGHSDWDDLKVATEYDSGPCDLVACGPAAAAALPDLMYLR